MSWLFLGILIGAAAGVAGPLFQYDQNEDGGITLWGGVFHSWGIWTLVAFIGEMFLWATGIIHGEILALTGVALLAQVGTAFIMAKVALPLFDMFSPPSLVKTGAKDEVADGKASG